MPTQQKLRVLTYNVKMLPGPFGDGDDDLARAERIAQSILGTQPQWDVVCLQEVFDEEARGVFARKLKKKFPFQVAKSSDHDVFEEDSGLFFASRHKIEGRAFREYGVHAGSDGLSDKGIFGARLAVGDVWVLVFHTHLQASASHRDVRQAQLRQVHGFVRSALERVPRTKVPFAILCGDLNVIAENSVGAATGEYTDMIDRLGSPRDIFRTTHPFATDAGFTWDGSVNTMIPKSDDDKQRLDYIFAWDRLPERNDDENPPTIGRIEVESVDVRRFEAAKPKLCLSDHFAVDATLSIK